MTKIKLRLFENNRRLADISYRKQKMFNKAVSIRHQLRSICNARKQTHIKLIVAANLLLFLFVTICFFFYFGRRIERLDEKSSANDFH